MARQLLNEAERFLLEHWADARLLEESIELVRTKYKEIFQRIIDAVTEAHPELDVSVARPTQFWCAGWIAFGRKSWPGGDSNWPAGLWIENLRLELLVADDSEPPSAYFWVPKKSKLDLDDARSALATAASELLTAEELNGISTGSGTVLLWFPAPSKGELLDALRDGDGREFVELFVSEFDMMARFVPALDKVFRECAKSEVAL